MNNRSPIRELDVVDIPEALALEAGAVQRGTVVRHVSGADFATVECRITGGDPLQTVLIDVPVGELRRTSA